MPAGIPAARSSGVWAPGRRRLTAGLVVTVTLVALESLSVATILPVVSRQLGDLRLYGWVFSAFFLANLVGSVLSGSVADRRGLRGTLLTGLVLFSVGLVVGGTAADMPLLVLGRFIQGLGAGAVTSSAYVTVGRTFSEADRPRMLAILSTAWVVPGLVGPVLAALVANSLGWRWVFLGLVPLIAGATTLAVPPLTAVPPPRRTDDRPRSGANLPFLPALAAAGGASAVLAGLTVARPLPTAGLLAGGLALGIPALHRLTPPGTLRARPGLPVAVLSRGLLTFAFFSGDAYVPFLLTTVRHRPTTYAGVTLTLGTLTWTVGSWIQERRIRRLGPRRFVAAGQGVVVVALGGLATCLWSAVPPWVAVVSWSLGGFGMGLAYAPVSLTALDQAPAGREGWATSAVQLNDVLGTALGAGVAGALVGLGQRHRDVRAGLGAALAAAAAVGILGEVLSHRLPTALRANSGTDNRADNRAEREGSEDPRCCHVHE